MAKISIKDLPDSVDLDREAMLAITGGARTRGRPAFPASTILRNSRVVAFPGGFTDGRVSDAKTRSGAKKAQ